MLTNKPEVLAPSGNMSALKAAVAAGADACYLAGNSFGARAFAGNFSDVELLEAIEHTHLYGVKIYLTINTLMKDNEFGRLYEMLVPLYEAGLDAVLIQDLGVMDFVRRHFPDLPIHTSTQMNILTPEGARFAKANGASRVVAAREMTLEELKIIKQEAGVELEAFVHGAMCVCYSGRCLMSSMIGGRSGNRGCCAQPCRKLYNGSYSLSMRDMCTLRYLPELIEAGIDSLKIEGRMKNEYYVAATVSAYKEMVLDYCNNEFSMKKAEDREKMLLDVFNRGGFTSGYLMLDKASKHDSKRAVSLIDDSEPGRRGVYVGKISSIGGGKISFKAAVDIGKGDELLIDDREPVSITCGRDISKDQKAELPAPETKRLKPGTAIYRTRSRAVTENLDEIINSKRSLPVDMKCVFRKGSAFKLSASSADDSGIVVSVTGSRVEEASSKPVTVDILESKLTRLGESEFEVVSFDADADEDAFIPVSELKKLRRELLDKLKDEITASYRRDNNILPMEDIHKEDIHGESSHSLTMEEKNKEIHVSVADMAQLRAVAEAVETGKFDINYLYMDMGSGGSFGRGDIADNKDIFDKIRRTTDVIAAFPYVNRGDYCVKDILEGDMKKMISGVYIRCIDDLASFLRFLETNEDYSIKTVVLGHSIYAYNSYAVRKLAGLFEAYDVSLYLEASYEISGKINDAILYPEGVKLVRSVYTRIPLMVTDAPDAALKELDDGRGSIYPVRFSDISRYSIVYDSKPLSLHEFLPDIDICKYDFTTESYKEVADVLSPAPDYIKNKCFTIGHFGKGI